MRAALDERMQRVTVCLYLPTSPHPIADGFADGSHGMIGDGSTSLLSTNPKLGSRAQNDWFPE